MQQHAVPWRRFRISFSSLIDAAEFSKVATLNGKIRPVQLALNLTAQFIWVCDFVERFEGAASSSNNDAAVPEYPAQKRFVNPNTFDLWHQDFDASTGEQTRFDEHAPVRNSHFGRSSADYAARDQHDGTQ